ncbi:MAG: hypothetical protein HEQ34_06235 [Sphingorhabdus sp.]|jgi:hypothetical protein|uniref:hypothetical protein n=1 Tax=Sphingorhabdus sp. TaxID=1902408 RepID=UPI0025FBC427|nr:hypothetical protein [Sphingorhabdus sp.]MCO4091536.1 hypothetical protein [Sphingorhabdus sp.]
MNMNIELAAARISRQVPLTEGSIDDALIQVSTLITQLVTARKQTGVSAATGQSTIVRLAKAQNALMTASSDVLRVHKDLAQLAEVHAGFDLHECPKNAITEATVTRLSVAS